MKPRPVHPGRTGQVPDATAPDPHGEHLLLLADGPTGYARLARAISLGHLAGEKSAPQFTLADVAGVTAGHVWALTGCRKGAVPAALVADGPAAAARQLDQLDRSLRARPRARRAVGPRRPARLGTQRRPRRARRQARRRLRRHRQRPLRHARRSAASPPPSPPSGPAAASPSSTPGSRRPPAPTCAPAGSSSGASPATPEPSSWPPRSAGRRRSTSPSSPRRCRRSRARTG